MAPLAGVRARLGLRVRLLRARGCRAFWRTWFAAWERADFEYEEFIDTGDSVVTILSQRVRGRTSGIELEWTSYGQVWRVRNGKIVHVEFFPTREEALKAAGLRE